MGLAARVVTEHVRAIMGGSPADVERIARDHGLFASRARSGTGLLRMDAA